MAKVPALRGETQNTSAVKQGPEGDCTSGSSADKHIHQGFLFQSIDRLETCNISSRCLAIAGMIGDRKPKIRKAKWQWLGLEVVLT